MQCKMLAVVLTYYTIFQSAGEDEVDGGVSHNSMVFVNIHVSISENKATE